MRLLIPLASLLVGGGHCAHQEGLGYLRHGKRLTLAITVSRLANAATVPQLGGCMPGVQETACHLSITSPGCWPRLGMTMTRRRRCLLRPPTHLKRLLQTSWMTTTVPTTM